MSDVVRTMPRFPNSLLGLTDGHPVINYANEGQLRDGLAERAWLAGWEVETERHIPGWGRIDLSLRCPGITIGVEIKVELVKPNLIRRAFQQADGYDRILGHGTYVYLVAARIDPAAVGPYEARYPHVRTRNANEFVDWLSGANLGMEHRHKLALKRAAQIWSWLETSHAVCADLARFFDSPLNVTAGSADENSDAGTAAALELFEGFFADPLDAAANPSPT